MKKYDKQEKEKFFYPDAGLGNRLYCLYSAIYWIKELKLNATILWEIEYACCVRFEELFEVPKDFNIKTIYSLSIKNDAFWRNFIGKLYIRAITLSHNFFKSQDTRDIYKKDGEKGIYQLLCSNRRIYLKSNSAFCNTEHLRKTKALLKPSKEIRNRVDEIIKPYKDKRRIGIHIRRTDNISSIQYSPVELFYLKMKEISDEHETVFYVASDDQEVIEELGKDFEVIRHKRFSDEITRKNSNGIKDAYVDMLCLSRCEKIYGSFASTFSVMSAIIGDIECEVLAL